MTGQSPGSCRALTTSTPRPGGERARVAGLPGGAAGRDADGQGRGGPGSPGRRASLRIALHICQDRHATRMRIRPWPHSPASPITPAPSRPRPPQRPEPDDLRAATRFTDAAGRRSESAICATSHEGSSLRLLTFRERQAPEVMDASGQIPMAAYDGGQGGLNGATHRAANHRPYAPDEHHLSPDQMQRPARCGAVTACHANHRKLRNSFRRTCPPRPPCSILTSGVAGAVRPSREMNPIRSCATARAPGGRPGHVGLLAVASMAVVAAVAEMPSVVMELGCAGS